MPSYSSSSSAGKRSQSGRYSMATVLGLRPPRPWGEREHQRVPNQPAQTGQPQTCTLRAAHQTRPRTPSWRNDVRPARMDGAVTTST